MQATEAAETASPPPGGWKRDLSCLLLLLALAGGIRAWVVGHTEVLSRDGITFIDYTLQLESRPWKDVLRGNHQHPGYPLSVLAVSLPVRHFLGGTDCVSMQLSAQCASALAGLLLVIPMFYLGKTLFDRGVGFWAALLFQCLPVSGRILSDGLSESLFFLLTATALLLAVRAVRAGSPRLFALCGVCSGLAYMTRPEGVVVPAATALFLIAMRAMPAWRWPWRRSAACGAALALAGVVVGSPYLLVTHHLSNKPSSREILRPRYHAEAPAIPAGLNPAARRPGFPLAVWLNQDLPWSSRAIKGLRGILAETTKGFQYFGCIPVLLGLWWYRDRLRTRPEVWLILTVVLVHTLALWRLAVVAGYVSERHVLLLVLCGTFPAVAAVRDMPARWLAWRRRKADSPAVHEVGRPGLLRSAPAWSVLLLLALAGSGLPKTLKPLHADRAGHHAAGRWLADHARPWDEVRDGHFGWAHFYAGRLVHDQQPVPPPPGTRPLCYVVKGRSREAPNPYGPTNAAADMTEDAIRTAGGRIVYHWPEQKPVEKATVVVWALLRN